MALEFICFNTIEYGEKINIPESPRATHYRCKSGKVKFFKINPCTNGFKEIPCKAREICFSIDRNKFNIEYGRPKFYDSERNHLKISNY